MKLDSMQEGEIYLKKICIMLLAAIMLVFSAMPAYALIAVGNDSFNADFVLQDGAIQYSAADKKLILNGATIDKDGGYPIYANEGEIREIELIGENTITANGNDLYGLMFMKTDVRIYGSGSLKITAGYTPLYIYDGSLTIDGTSIETVQTGSVMSEVFAEGNVILTNGAQLRTKKLNTGNNTPTIKANDESVIEISGDSRLIIDTYQSRTFYGGILCAEHVKLSDTSRIEIISPADSRPGKDVYAASEVYLVNGESENNRNIFSIDRFTSAKDNRFTVTQTAEDDGRYKLVIQGEKVDAPAEIPETGDRANLPLYAAMLLLSAGAMILMKKRENA